ncbi:uncharacterized protein LOC113136424 [Mastacembelus armatus]|uniref:uncharacterized protein LOC113136424 n=1 Tax=Mastacembelus armatus TaxID=205130 RepID=UPI000E46060C|nr:uncharacterized protein LOC113136424 [Mastacembelus armatus]XP_026173035.1 uncharacterized protein LOC113136424 [Mastacembelus armatus]
MSMAVLKDKAVTEVTVAADSKNTFPLLCKILKTLCCSSVCCSEYKGLMQTSVAAALGTIQIMVGLFNIGLGPGRTSTHPGDLTSLRAAYWLGALYTATGILSLLVGRYPSLCLVGFAVFVNIVGSIFAIVGIVLYATDLRDASVIWMCNSPNAADYKDNCINVAYFAQSLLTGMDITLIVLAVLQLCVCISFAVLGIRALANRKKKEGGRPVGIYQAVLKEVLMTSPGA